ncbi:asparagine synthase (glutamine-hydrolyzing) [Patescibacteria group bacterium]
MCGITGFIGTKNLPKLEALLKTIEHRGRDGKALHYSKGIHLGMNRLAIIDLSQNLYPMKYKHYTLVFNGEIYNFKELKNKLNKKKIKFKTSSDAEVILPLYDLYGHKSFSMLEGMFAISIYDSKKFQLILVRDKSGEKPLYYINDQANFVFASEIKTIIKSNNTSTVLDKRALTQYLTHGFVQSPDTLAKDIKKVPPSSFVTYDINLKKINTKKYWTPLDYLTNRESKKSKQYYIDELEELLKKSVKSRLIADVPVGCFLSGGIDSSLITYFAAREKPHIRTFSVSFPGHKDIDESDHALNIAKQLKTKHTVITCTSEKAHALLNDISDLVDEPIVDPAVIPTYLMAKEACKHVKVVLTGEGADEMFGGYIRYFNNMYLEKFKNLFSNLPFFNEFFSSLPKNRLKRVSKPLFERYSPQRVWDEQSLTKLLKDKDDFSHNERKSLFQQHNPLLAMQLTDYRGYMADQLLMKIDKSTMANNLEARVPYLDTQIIIFALGLSNKYKVRLFENKYVLRKMAEKHLPKSWAWRKKRGFDLPLKNWFRNDFREEVYKSVEHVKNYEQVLNLNYYRHIIKEHMEHKYDHSNKIWSMMVLSKWMVKNKVKI